MHALLLTLTVAGAPRVERVVAWDPASEAVLYGLWDGVGTEAEARELPLTRFELRRPNAPVERFECPPPRAPSCPPGRDRLTQDGAPVPLAGYRVRWAGKKASMVKTYAASIERKEGATWRTVATVQTFVPPSIARVVASGGKHVVFLRQDIEAFVPSSRELAVFCASP